jgi:D-3-phosphoglycerate dehydrogenase/C-terminal binding protein
VVSAHKRIPDKSAPRVAIIDSRWGRYVETPDIEERILGPAVAVEVFRVEAPEELHGHVEDVDGIISWHHIAIDRELLIRLRRCRGIVRAAVGFDNIDLKSATECKIPICNVPDYGTEEVADHTLALLLALVRRLRSLDEHCRRGGWDWRTIGRVQRLRGATLGIVGFGRIGSAVARRAAAFGMDVVFYDPYLPSGVEKAHGVRRAETFEELLGLSSIISLHVPLTAETRGMVDERALALLAPGAVLINTSRGPVVEQRALIAALDNGRLDGAGLDVLASEPDVPEALRTSNRVLLTAHAAFYADAALTELREKAARSVARLLGGKPERNLLNGVDHGARSR